MSGSSFAPRVLDLLDFESVRRELLDLALSDDGRALIAEQAVLTERERIEELLDAVGDWKMRMTLAGPEPAFEFPPIAERLRRLAKEGAVADGADLAAIAIFVLSGLKLKGYLSRSAPDRPRGTESALQRRAAELPELPDLSAEIRSVIGPDGALRDERVPELRTIRHRIVRLHGEIDELARRHLSGNRSMWQTDVPTDRDGRTVLPLKADYRGRVEGIVHEVSASGATLYVEPFDIVERNNGLVEAHNRYRQEVARILRLLSERVRASLAPLEALVERVAFLDSLRARARYAKLHSCTRARASEHGLLLRSARHPPLGAKAVPIDVEVDEDTKVLVVTGPNTGGKTVALKTVGLLSAMNQFAMEIPAAEGSALPLFDAIYLDIGDEQSVAGSLSTFSAHMRNLSAILESATARSLVLLDEVGSGTDPEEGTAIAVALLERLRETCALTVVTTHNGAIKGLGVSREGIMNASVAFDAASLSPTFRIVMGAAGESRAIDIAERNGLNRAIVARAREYLDVTGGDLSRALRDVERRGLELAERASACERTEEALRKKEGALEERERAVRSRETALRAGDVRELADFLRESRRRLENLVRELRSSEIGREQTVKVKGFIAELDRRAEEEEERLQAAGDLFEERSSAPVPARPRALAPGAEVLVGAERRRGTVLRRQRGDRWLVACKTLRMTVRESDLVVVASEDQTAAVTLSVGDVAADNRPEIQLDLRGMRLAEALRSLELQIDRAVLAGLGEFSVVHGLGEGVLQQGVHAFLRESPRVVDFRFSRPEEGGYGRTVVLLA